MESMHMVELNAAPSNLDVLLGMVSGDVSQTYEGKTRQATFRLPFMMWATLKAMSDVSPNNESMNTIVEQLIRIAVEQVEEKLPGHVYARIDQERERIIAEEAVRT